MILYRILIILFCLNITSSLYAAKYYSQGSNTFSVTANWNDQVGGGGASPLAGDLTSGLHTFVVQDGHTITIDQNIDVDSLIIGDGTSGILQFDNLASDTAVTRGSVLVNVGASFNVAAVINTSRLEIQENLINNGTYNMKAGTGRDVSTVFNNTGLSTISGTTSPVFSDLVFDGTANVTPSVALDVNGSVTIETGATFADGGLTHTVESNWTENGTGQMTGTGTIQFDGATTNSITTTATFNNLTFNGGNGASFILAAIIVNGKFLVTNNTTVISSAIGDRYNDTFQVDLGSTYDHSGAGRADFQGVSVQEIILTGTVTFGDIYMFNGSQIAPKNITGNLVSTNDFRVFAPAHVAGAGNHSLANVRMNGTCSFDGSITFTGSATIRDDGADNNFTLGSADIIIDGRLRLNTNDTMHIGGNLTILNNAAIRYLLLNNNSKLIQDSTGKSFTMQNLAYLYVRGPDNFPDGFGSYSFDKGSLTLYDAVMVQTVRGGVTYGGLYLRYNTKTADGPINIDNDLYLYNSVIFNSGANKISIEDNIFNSGSSTFNNTDTVIFDAPDDNQTLSTGATYNFEDVIFTNTAPTASRTKNIDANLNVGGRFIAANSGGSSGILLIIDPDANNIVNDGDGIFSLGANVRLNTSGANSFDSVTTFATVGLDSLSIVRFDRNGAQNIPGLTYGKIELRTSGNKTAVGNFICKNDFSSSGTVPVFYDGGFSHQVKGNWQVSQTYTSAASMTGRIEFNGANQNISASYFEKAIFAGSGTKTMNGSINVDDSFDVKSGVALDANIYSINSAGHFVIRSGASLSQVASGTVTFDGSGVQILTFAGTGSFYNLRLGKTSGTSLVLLSNIDVDNTLTINNSGGILNAASDTITIGNDFNIGTSSGFGTANYISNGLSKLIFDGVVLQDINNWASSTFNDMEFIGAGEKRFLRNAFDINGDVTIIGSTVDGASVDLNVAGNWNNTGVFQPGGRQQHFDGSSLQTISSSDFNHLYIDNNADTVRLVGNINVTGNMTISNNAIFDVNNIGNYSITIENNWVNNLGGQFLARLGTVTFDGATSSIYTGGIGTGKEFYNLTSNALAPSQTRSLNGSGAVKINGDFTVVNGSGIVYTYNNDWYIGGNFSDQGGVFYPNTSTNTVFFDGVAGTYNFEPGPATQYRKIRVTGAATYQLTGDLTFSSSSGSWFLQVSAGTFDLNSNKLLMRRANASVDVIVDGGTLEIDSAATLELANNNDFIVSAGTLRVVGDPNGPANITSTTGGYDFDITGGTIEARYYNIANTRLNGLTISAPATIDATNNFSDGTFSGGTGSYYLTFNDNVLNDDTAQNVIFSSGPTGNVNRVTGASATDISFENSGGALTGPTYETDPDNEVQWIFPSGKTWDRGAGTDSWFDAANWNPDGVPDSSDLVTLDHTWVAGAYDVDIDALTLAECNDMVIQGGAGNIYVDFVTANSQLQVNGSVTLSDAASIIRLNNSADSIRIKGGWDNNGQFISGGGTIVFNDTSGASYTIVTGGTGNTQDFDNFVIDAKNSTYTVSGDQVEINGDMNIVAGTFVSSERVYCAGDWTMFGGAIFTSTEWVFMDGNTTQLINGGVFYNLYNNNSVDTVRLASSATVNNAFRAQTGVFDGSTYFLFVGGEWRNNSTANAFMQSGLGTVVFDGINTQNITGTSSTVFNNVLMQGTGVKRFQIDAKINGDWTINNGPGSVRLGTFTVDGGSNTNFFEMNGSQLWVEGANNFPDSFETVNLNNGYVMYRAAFDQTISSQNYYRLDLDYGGAPIARKTAEGDISMQNYLRVLSVNTIFDMDTFDLIITGPVGNTTDIQVPTGGNQIQWTGKGTLRHLGDGFLIDADIDTLNNMIISGTGLKRMYGNLNMKGDVTIQNGVQFDMQTFPMNSIASGKVFTLGLGTRLDCGVPTATDTAFPMNFATYAIDAASNVYLDGTAPQTIYHIPNYGNLTLTGNNTAILAGDLDVEGNFDNTNGSNSVTLIDNGFDINVAGATVRLVDYSPSTSSTFTLDGGDQDIRDDGNNNLLFNNLFLGNAGTKTFSDGNDDIDIAGTFWLDTGVAMTTAADILHSGPSWDNFGTFSQTANRTIFDGTVTQSINPGTNNSFFQITFSNGGANPKYVHDNGFDVNGNWSETFVVDVGATLNSSAVTHNISNQYITVNGTIIGDSTNYIFDHTGNQTISITDFTAKNITCAGTGSKIMGGNWFIDSLTIDGGVTLDATTTGYDITLTGSWINNGGTFNERNLSTTFFESDDATDQTIDVGASNFYKLKFNQTQTNTRTYTLTNATTLVEDSLIIGNGATLDLNSNQLTIGNNDAGTPAGEVVMVETGATLEVDANAILAFDHYDLDPYMQVDGTLRVVGTAGNLATVTRAAGTRETNIDVLTGMIEAEYYHFEYLVNSGLYVASTATLHNTRNFSNGVWSNMQTSGGVRRYLQLDAPMTGVDSVRNVTFNYGGTPSVGTTFNISRDPASTDTVYMTGTLSGPLSSFVYEGDDGTANDGLITWGEVSEVTWTGAVSINWDDPLNWSPNLVPTISLTANIPLQTNNPTIFASDANCNNLNITTGLLTVERNLTITGDASIGAGASGVLAVATDTTLITVRGAWTVANGATYTHGNAKVRFDVTSGSVTITPNGNNFNKLEFIGGANYFIAGATVTVEDSFIIGNSAIVALNTAGYTLNIEGDFINNGIFDNSTAGLSIFNGTGAQTIKRGFFYDLTIDGAGTKTVVDSMDVRQDVIVNSILATSGTAGIKFSSDNGNYDVTINTGGGFVDGGGSHTFQGQDWRGDGTYSGTGTVTFSRTGTQYVYDAKFNNLVFDGTGAKILLGNDTIYGDVTVNNTISYLNLQTFTMTHSPLAAGQFTLSAAENLYVRGTNNFPSGFASYNFDPTSNTYYDAGMDQVVYGATYGNVRFSNGGTKTLSGNIDVNGSLFIFINTTLDVSVFDYQINCAGRFYNGNQGNFIARQGTVILDGTAAGNQDVDEDVIGIKDFYNLTVDKTAGTARLNWNDKTILNDVLVLDGILSAAGENITVGGNLLAQGGTFAQSGTWTLNNQTDTAYIQMNGSVLNDLVINGNDTTIFKLLDNADIYNNFTLTKGTFAGNGNTVKLGWWSDVISISGTYRMGAGGTMQIGPAVTLTVNVGGALEAVGTSGNLATVTRRSTSNYNFTVDGTIDAMFCIFEYMSAAGINISSSATVDTTNNFSECTFTNGVANGTFLKIENTQDLNGTNRIVNASFLANPGGGAANVTKLVGVSGTVEFFNATGVFAGEAFDDDPNSLIIWSSPVTLTWKATAASSDWYDKNNWSVSSGPDTIPYCTADAIIVNSVNPPIITSGGARAQNLDVQLGGILMMNTPVDSDTDLVVCADMTIGGSFILSSSNDTTLVRGNWDKTGAFSAATGGAIIFEPTGATKSIDNGASQFYDVIISGLGTIQLAANTFINNNFSALSGANINFDTRDVTIKNGDFINAGNLNGGSGKLIFDSDNPVTHVFNPGTSVFTRLDLTGNASSIVRLTGNNLTTSDNVDIQSGTFDVNNLTFNFGDGMGVDILSINGPGGVLNIDENAFLRMANTSGISVNSGGRLNLIGLNGANVATLTRQNTGTYSATVNSGGTVAARFYMMEYIGATGFEVKAGGTVDPTNNLSDGLFQNGTVGGRYLLLENDFLATDTMENVVFNSGPSFNVRRTGGANNAVFKNSNGALFAWLAEDDSPNNQPNTGKIRWVFDFPISVWTGATDTNWHDVGNWDCACIPDATFGVFINNEANDPVIYAADADVLQVNMFTGSDLKFNSNRNLTINGSLTNSDGTITVSNGSASTIEVHDLWAMGLTATFNSGDASTVVLKGDIGVKPITTGGDCFYNLHIDSTATFQATSSMCILGDLRVLQGTFDMINTTYALNIGGDYENTATTNLVSTTTTFDGTGAQSIGNGTFNNVVFNGGNGVNTIAGTVIVNGDLTVQSGDTLNGGIGNDTLDLNGDFTINFGASYVGNTGRLMFSGSSNQNISGPSTGITLGGLILNNTAGDLFRPQVVSNTPLTINANGSLVFTDGILSLSNATHYMTVNDGVTLTGGTSNASYLSSTMRKIGNDAWTFPIGDANTFARIGISAPANITASFEANYTRSTTSFYTDLDAPLVNISVLEYWNLNRIVGGVGDDVFVTLYWDNDFDHQITNLDSIVVTRYNGATWESHGQGAQTGNTVAGSITSSAVVTSFSPFTFGNIGNAVGINPLPVQLIAYDAILEDGVVVNEWSTASEIDNDYFVVERTIDLENYDEIGIVEGAGNSIYINNYQLIDESPLDGVSYYRLKQVDFDGTFSYSDIVAVNNVGVLANFSMDLYPNPATSQDARLFITGKEFDDITISVIDELGRQVYTESITLGNTSTTKSLDPQGILKQGVYLIVINRNGERITKKLVLQQ